MKYLLALLLFLALPAQAQTFDEIEVVIDSLAHAEMHGPDSLGTSWLEMDFASGKHAEIFFVDEQTYTWLITTADSARIYTPTHGVIAMAPVTLSRLQYLSETYDPGSIMAVIETVQAIGAAKLRTQPIIDP